MDALSMTFEPGHTIVVNPTEKRIGDLRTGDVFKFEGENPDPQSWRVLTEWHPTGTDDEVVMRFNLHSPGLVTMDQRTLFLDQPVFVYDRIDLPPVTDDEIDDAIQRLEDVENAQSELKALVQ